MSFRSRTAAHSQYTLPEQRYVFALCTGLYEYCAHTTAEAKAPIMQASERPPDLQRHQRQTQQVEEERENHSGESEEDVGKAGEMDEGSVSPLSIT